MAERNILESLIDYLKPKAHDSIDKITNLFKSNEEIEFEKLLESTGIDKDSDDANILRNYMEKVGMPYIKSYEDAWPAFTEGEWSKKRSYDKALSELENVRETKYIRESPDTLHIRPGNIDDFVEELAHAVQYNPRKKDGEYRKVVHYSNVFKQNIRDSLNRQGGRQVYKYGQKRYDIPGTTEYEAHEVIAPSIWNKLSNSLLEETMGKWEKDAPRPNPSNPRWLSKYLKAE